MGAGLGVDQDHADTDPGPRPADAPLHDVAGAQFLAHLTDIGRLATITAGRFAGDHEQVREPRNPGRDVPLQAVGKGLNLRVAGGAAERQHRDPRHVAAPDL